MPKTQARSTADARIISVMPIPAATS